MIIPETVNRLTMREAFLFYRDDLKIHVYPVDGPWSKKADPGKKPSVKAWWDFNPHDCNLERFFGGNGKCHNIGCAPKNKLVFVDLDSKHDKGQSVRKFLENNPGCSKGPWHETNNGAHLVFVCTDLPKISTDGALLVSLADGVTAALYFSDHSNIVLPPSLHIQGFVYRWTTVGEIPEISWQWLQDTFGFQLPKKEHKGKKDVPWHLHFRGDFASLDLIALLEALGHPAELLSADEDKYSVLCPWHAEHGKGDEPGTSTVLWQTGDEWPGFKCLHDHCSERKLRELLEWAEGREPGVVDRFCKRQRVYVRGQREADGRPRVVHPGVGRLVTKVYNEIAKAVRPSYSWFKRAIDIVIINQNPTGFIYADNADTEYKVRAHTVGFNTLSAQDAKGLVERHVVPGVLDRDELGNPQFRELSFGTDFCHGLVGSSEFRGSLPEILRILTVPLPVKVGGRLVFPKSGYDPQFGTFLVPDAPQIKEMALEKAIKLIEGLHAEFPFTNAQSKCHAIARLLTPFARGLLGWTTRVPLWFYIANRPRAGKDYLAAVPLLVYEGNAFEDVPLGKDSEETRKRLISSARSGRRFMHFSNCQGYLQDPYFYQVITAEGISARNLGATEASSDLTLPNEMEFSLSANVGLTYREDFEGRMRKIELAYFEEDANSRRFKRPFLHQDIKDHRSEIVSAIAAVFRNWERLGFPVGPTVFTSFPQWAQVIGGVMVSAGLGDPCEVQAGEYDQVGGDAETVGMRSLFKVCHEKFGNEWVEKKEVYACVQGAAGDSDALAYFGPLADHDNAQGNRVKLGKSLSRFRNRELGGIKLEIDIKKDISTNRYRFLKSGDAGNPGGPQAVRVEEVFFKCENTPKINTPIYASRIAAPTDPQNPKEPQISMALDIETFSEPRIGKRGKVLKSRDALNAQKGDIRLVQMADSKGIVVRDLRERPLFREEREALETQKLIAHNVAFELRFLGTKLALVAKSVFCTMTASKLLHPGREFSHKLGDVLERHLGVKIPKDLGSSDWGAMLLTEEQMEYARNDVRFLHGLKEILEEELQKAKLTHVFEMECRLILVTAAMEVHGFAIDSGAMRALKAVSDTSAANLAAQIRQDFGNEKLNPASPLQLVKAFTEAGEKLENADEETLMGLEDPRAKTILQFRTAAKLSSNIETLLKAEHHGRIHSIFNPFGATTGRFSSKEPNLQNVTRGPLRACFIPSAPDRKLIVADYSQIELRVAALVAGEKVMIEAFKNKEDLHHKTAASALGREITKQERAQVGKATNFGFLYGQGADGFVRYARTNYELLLTLDEARGFHANHFSLYPGLKAWHSRCWEKAENPLNKSARTIFGRLLLPDGDRKWNRFVMFTNYVVQGSCADLIKAAMLKTVSVLPKDVRLVATVHDELIFDAPADMAGHYRDLIHQAMVDAFVEMFGETVPVEVEAKVCNHWGDK